MGLFKRILDQPIIEPLSTKTEETDEMERREKTW
jgi:hypothetical protein